MRGRDGAGASGAVVLSVNISGRPDWFFSLPVRVCPVNFEVLAHASGIFSCTGFVSMI